MKFSYQINIEPKELSVLNAVVESYIDLCRPISSNYLKKHYFKNYSSSHIRFLMNSLEKKNLLMHYHISGGRVPTDLGYRVYVDSFGDILNHNEIKKDEIEKKLDSSSENTEQLLEATAYMLSKMSNMYSVVMLHDNDSSILKNIEIVNINSDSRLMMILTLDNGLIRSIVLNIDLKIKTSFIDKIVLELKNKYDTKDIFVIIGWSSPERKDFFYKWNEKDTGEWECLYPAELDHWESKSDSLNAFYKLYTLNHWHEEEFITRHCLNNITLHNFLKALNIRHLFFNAFYESKEELFNPDKHQLFDAREIESYISNYQKSSEANTLKRLDINNIIDEYKRIHKEVFTKKSFIQFLFNLSEYNQDDLIDYHPTELGHELWAKELSTVLKNEI